MLSADTLCTSIRTYIPLLCTSICISIMYLHMYLCTSILTYVPLYLPMYIYTYLCTSIRTYVPLYVPMYLHMYIYTYLLVLIGADDEEESLAEFGQPIQHND